MPVDLLPDSSSPRTRAMTQAVDFYDRYGDAVSSVRTGKHLRVSSAVLPFLVYEYGLGALTPYVPNLYDVLQQGPSWARRRGTPAAVAQGLAWLSYGGTIEEPPARRDRWNLFQVALDRLRRSEGDLPGVEGVVSLSVSERSVFWRCFYGYDVRAAEGEWTRWDNTIGDAFSGVRLRENGTKWSFGRTVEKFHAMTQPELTALGVWRPPLTSAPRTWQDLPWSNVPWGTHAELQRAADMINDLDPQTAWVRFTTSAGAVIGYRRAKVLRRVTYVVSGGEYQFLKLNLAVAGNAGISVLVEALTDFGDAAGQTAAHAAIIFNAVPTGSHPIGALWLPPGALSVTGPAIAEIPVSIPFGQTVRERVRWLLEFI